jgi:hypothetical protein
MTEVVRPTEEDLLRDKASSNGRMPVAAVPSDGMHGPYDGITKREYIAALALQGLLTQPTMPPDGWSKMAVFQADDLLKELAK